MMLDQDACGQLVPDHHGRHESEALALSCHETQHRHVVDFRENDRLDARRVEQSVEGHAHAVAAPWQGDGNFRKIARKAQRPFGHSRMSDQTDGLFGDQSALPIGVSIGRRRLI